MRPYQAWARSVLAMQLSAAEVPGSSSFTLPIIHVSNKIWPGTDESPLRHSLQCDRRSQCGRGSYPRVK